MKLLIGVFTVICLSGCNELATAEMNRIENQVAQDAVAQYEIAARQGDAMQKCVQAGLVSAAFLQAQDESNYMVWKSTEKSDCAQAGLPQ